MPLKLWLPLDGTNENRGISGTVMTGSPNSWGNGRTGKCAVFSNNTGNCISSTARELDYTVEDFSWAMWLKKDFASMTAANMYAFTVGRADAGGYGYGLRILSSTQIIFRFGSGGSSTWTVDCPDNEWHHFAFTRKGTAIKIYRDGAPVTSATFGGNLPTYSDGTGPGIGCFHYTGNIYPLIGAISDFRIYNHTLSAKEVYELSRALIVHYPLSAPGNANPNLLTWAKNYTESNPWIHTSASKDGWMNLGADSLVTVTPGKVYYVQVKSDGVPHSSHASSAGVVTNKFTLWFYVRNVGTTKTAGSGYDQTVCFTSASTGLLVNDPERQLYVWTWTAPSNAQDITLRTNSYSDGTTAVTLKFWDFKIEEDTYTSYIPSRNSAQYVELGYGSGTVRDATGRGNDTIINGTYASSAEPPRYASAINFSGTSYLWPVPDKINSETAEFSIACWFRTDALTASTNQCIYAGRTTAGKAVGIIVLSNGSNMYVDDSNRTTVGVSFAANTWYHIVVTWKSGGNKVVYVNGVQKSSVAAGTLAKTNVNASIGRLSTNDALVDSDYVRSAMSDFRLYGTALTADDVKYLYETSAAIDNSGDMFADSFEETEMLPRVGKEGLVYGKNLSESGGTVCAYANTNKGAIDPNRNSWSYTPTTADNSCMTGLYFWCISGVQKYRIELLITWSGFSDISTSSTNFNAFFQGYTYNASGNRIWVDVGPMNAAMNSSKSLASLAKGAASGTYLYNVEFTLPNTWPDTYKGNEIGIRTNYSNGTGKWTISKVRIYPADEHMVDQASLCSSGAIQVRLADEVSIA